MNYNRKEEKVLCQIYSKYVYDYLKAGVCRKLNRLVPDILINSIGDTFE